MRVTASGLTHVTRHTRDRRQGTVSKPFIQLITCARPDVCVNNLATMLVSYTQSRFTVILYLTLASVVKTQMLHSKPIHSISVNNKYYDVVVDAGTEIIFRAIVTDAGMDLTSHSIAVMHPNGTMSYDGWLSDGDWDSNNACNGSVSVKTAKVTVVDEGKNCRSVLPPF